MTKPKVSIIISNRNDVAMLAVTVRSCLEELKPLGPNAGEIVIVDNSDIAAYNLLKSALPTGYCREGKQRARNHHFSGSEAKGRASTAGLRSDGASEGRQCTTWIFGEEDSAGAAGPLRKA